MRFLTISPLLTALLTCSPLAQCLPSSANDDDAARRHSTESSTGFFVNGRVPSLPLAVKSPYLSAWLPVGDKEPELAGRWPEFWTGHHLEWAGMIRVNNDNYVFLGDAAQLDQPRAKQVFHQFSSTRTIFGFQIQDTVQFNVTFFTPVEPDDAVQHSLPFSFFEVSVVALNDKNVDVAVYTDIGGDWLTNDLGVPIFWKTVTSDGLLYHAIEAFAPQVYDEHDDRSMYGRVVLASNQDETTSYSTGPHSEVRGEFVRHGRLNDKEDSKYRRIGDNTPILAMSKRMSVSERPESALFAIGHVRDPAISYRPTILEDPVDLKLLYYSKYATWQEALHYFYYNHGRMLQSAIALDLLIYSDASMISDDYARICALSLRQAYASVELTGNDMNDVRAWMKEISSDGNLNTVDVIYPAMPLFLYLSPKYLGWLIEPVLRYQSEGAKYESCAHDLGSHYPYATGPSDGSQSHMPVEESGDILIIALAHAQATGDISLISKYYNLFQQWTAYLLKKALTPEDQLSTDDFMGSITNSSSLALKGGIGIAAMARIAELTGRDGSKYASAANKYIKAWQILATSHARRGSNARLLLNYHHQDSWMLAYNLYAERLLGIDLIPKEVFDEQDAWYPTQWHKFGVPLDSRRTQTKSDWLIWAAAATHNESVSKMLVQGVSNFLSGGGSDAPFSDWYETLDGTSPGFRARPVVGGHFAFLALDSLHRKQTALSMPSVQATPRLVAQFNL